MATSNCVGAFGFPFENEPTGYALKARPPESQKVGEILPLRKAFLAHFKQVVNSALVKGAFPFLSEAPQDIMDDRPLFCPSRRRTNRIEVSEAKDMLGIERVRVTHPGFNLGDRKRAGPCIKWRAGCWPFNRDLPVRRVKLARPTGELFALGGAWHLVPHRQPRLPIAAASGWERSARHRF